MPLLRARLPRRRVEALCPDGKRLLATRMRFLFSVSFPGNFERRVLVEQAWPIASSIAAPEGAPSTHEKSKSSENR